MRKLIYQLLNGHGLLIRNVILIYYKLGRHTKAAITEELFNKKKKVYTRKYIVEVIHEFILNVFTPLVIYSIVIY